MAIHVPLSLKAQAEAKTLLISTNNCTLPSTGQPNIIPSQDMILGCYILTTENSSLKYILKKIMRLTIIRIVNKNKSIRIKDKYFPHKTKL